MSAPRRGLRWPTVTSVRCTRLLRQYGVSQREIGGRTGQPQSEVSDIVRGRRVLDVTVLERICDGLGVPRHFIHLWGPADDSGGTYPGGGTATSPPVEVDEEMYRRALLAAGGVAVVGRPVDKLGQLLALPGPAPVPLPSRVGGVHVARVRDLTRRLGEAGNPVIAAPEVLSAAVEWAERLLGVLGTEPVNQALLVAVAELHIEAGWAGFDAGLNDRAMYHWKAALELATAAGDAYLEATAMHYAGVATMEHGDPNYGLKLLQLAQVKAWDIPHDEQRAVVVGNPGRTGVEAGARQSAATALADLGKLPAAEVGMAKSRELWSATRADRYGDLDRPAALLALRQGQLDVAEPLAAASVHRWEGVSQVGHTQSGIVLATVHVRAEDRDGLPLAHGAITAVTKLSSVRARRKLQPLAAALTARPGRDAQDLARMAQQVASARA